MRRFSHTQLFTVLCLSSLLLVAGWFGVALAADLTINFENPPYSTGSIHTQDGWSSSGASGSGCAIYDHAVVANTYGYASFGAQNLRMSNAVTSGCFGDQTFSKSLPNEAGETSAQNGGISGGVRKPFFEAQWDFASTVPGAEQPGLSVVASPDRGDGARMSWVQMADKPAGLEVNFYDYQHSVGDFVFTNVITGLNRTIPHTVKIEMYFVDGAENDVVKVYVDGVHLHTGTSWEDYFRDEESNPTRTVDSILFRTGGAAAPATAGNGFLIDNLTLSSATVTQCTTTCYVDAVNGSDGYGGTSIADAKKTIQAAIDTVSPSGTVRVLPGTYNETATNRFVLGVNGPHQFGLYIGPTKNGVIVMGVTAGDVPITDPTATLATVNTNATNNFGTSGIFVEGDNVTIQGLKIGPNTAGDNKTIEIIGDAFVLKDSTTAIPDGGGSIYFGDWRFDTGTNTSYIQSYTVKGNRFDDGTQVALSSGAGFSGPVSGRQIINNTFIGYTGQNWPHISFNGAGGVPWYAYPVGGAEITGNSFVGSTQHIRARGDYTNSEMDWTAFWNSNSYDKAVVDLIGAYPPFDVRPFSYVSGSYTFTNVRRIGALIQGEVDHTLAADTVLVRQGSYPEAVTIDKTLTLQGATSDKTLHVINGTGLGVTSGIVLNNGVTGVTIKNLTVQNFTGAGGNANAGIYGVGGNNGLTIDNVALLNNPTASGFYANGPVDDVSVTNSMVANNGAGARGIVIWNGLKSNITITGNMLTNNACCGIEMQDGTASGVNISGNTINIGSGDNAIGAVGLNSSVGANIISSNIITGGGRFGIEIKNPAGGVTVNGNQVTLSTQNADLRDRAGIAILRRSVLAGNVDVPNGVTITGNTVTGYQQTSTSEGFGIVVEGTNHTVTGNTVSSSDVGILQQQNPSNYPGDADQSNLADQYFGRGNSPMTCGNTISGNTFSSNGVDTRNIGAGSGIVQNTNTSESFCSIQAAINDSDTLAGHQLLLSAGVFSGTVTINKDVDIVGAGSGQDACVQNNYSGVSVLRAASGAVVTLAANGASTANPILLQNLRIEAVNQQAINVAPAASKVKLDGVKVMGSNPNTNASSEVGLRLGTAATITDLDVVNSSFNCLHFGWFFAQSQTTPGLADWISVNNTKWLSNTHRALYVEKLSNALFKNGVVDNNGWFSGTASLAFNGGFDINLKFANYQNITLEGMTFTDNGNGRKEGAALSVKARDDAPSYNSPPATLATVVITGSTFSNNERGIRFGEPGKVNTGPTNVKVQNNQITNNTKSYAGSDGSTYGGVINHTSSPSIKVIRNNLTGNSVQSVFSSSAARVDAKFNWWGNANGPGPVGPGSGDNVSTYVDFCGWLDAPAPGGAVVPAQTVQNVNTGEYFCSIQAAIDDSDTVNGHTLNVGVGTFTELVTVNKSVTLRGAQNGVDGRTRCDATAGETIMNGSQGAFNVQANDVVIDGFVIENSTNTTYLGTGVYLPGSFSGYQVRNNVFRNNIFGLYLNSNGVKQSVAEKNCFKTNNQTGPANGNGVYSDQSLSNAQIKDNYFTGHDNTAILLTGLSAATGVRNVQITGNEFRQDNRIRLTYASDVLISGNTNVGSIVHGVQIAGGSKNITITNNTLTDALFAGVRVADSDEVGPNRNIVILNNVMNRNVYGLWVGGGALDGALTARFNQMISNTIAVTTQTTLAGIDMTIERNNISLNSAGGMQNSGGPTLNGRCNWWGAANGPGPVGPGSGDTVSADVIFSPFLLTSDLNGPCLPSIKVVKVVVGDPPATPWQFTGTGAMGAFTLPVAGGVKNFFDLGAGAFTISETPNPAYTSAASCSNGATGGSSVNVTIGASDMITCTFTNTRQMVNITIVKQAAPQSATNFRFSGAFLGGGSGSDSQPSIADFYLDDPASDDGDAFGASKSFGVPRGAVYSFSEAAVSGWHLMGIDCNPAASATVNLATRSVSINTSAGNDVTCTFRNEQAGVLNVRKHRESNGTLGQQAPEAFLSAWTIQVKTTPTGTLVAQAATNALGKVSFSLKPGSYQVCEVMKNSWKHWVNPNNLCFPVVMSAGGVTAKDFGNCLIASCPVSPSAVDEATTPAAPVLVLGADELEGWVEGWLTTPDGPVEAENGEQSEPDAGQRLFLPLITN